MSRSATHYTYYSKAEALSQIGKSLPCDHGHTLLIEFLAQPVLVEPDDRVFSYAFEGLVFISRGLIAYWAGCYPTESWCGLGFA